MFMLRVKTLSTWDHHWRNPRKKKYRECSNIKARMSVHWRAQCHTSWSRGKQRLSASCRNRPNRTQVALLTVTHLNHWGIMMAIHPKWYMTCSLLQPATFFCAQDCRSRIAQVEYQEVYLLWKPRINCVEFEFFLGPLKTPKLRTVVSRYQPSSTRLAGGGGRGGRGGRRPYDALASSSSLVVPANG